MIPFVLVLVAICFSVTGELFLKAGMNQVGILSFSTFGSDLVRTLTNTRVLSGFASIGVGAIFWLAALSRAQLSWAYPLLALGYILILLFSVLILREHVSTIRWIGAVVIVIGVFLVTRS